MLVAICAVISHRRFGELTTIRLLFVLATLLALALVWNTPMSSAAADMLPIIGAAGQHFLHGHSPYGVVFPDASVFPFYYLPGLWLPYVPLIALDLDLRLLNLSVYATTPILVERCLAASGFDRQDLGIAFYPILMSPMVAQILVLGQVWPYLFLVVTLGCLLVSNRLALTAFVIGLMLATRQWAIFIVWPLAIHLIAKISPKTFISLFLIAVTGFSALMLPIYLLDNNVFNVTFIDVAKNAPQALTHERTTSQIGLLSLIRTIGLNASPFIMMSALAVIAGVFSYRVRGEPIAWLLCLVGIFYMLFISCNFQVFRYYYLPGLLLLGIGFPIVMQSKRACSDLP